MTRSRSTRTHPQQVIRTVLWAAALVMASGGLVATQPVPAAAAEAIATPDSTGVVGLFPSLALDASGNPVIAYHDATNLDLKVLRCADATCSPGGAHSIASPDTGGNVGRGASLALDAAGNPIVSYDDSTNAALKVMRCVDATCSPERIHSFSTFDGGNVAGYSSIARTSSDAFVISFSTTTQIGVLNCVGFSCELTHPPAVGLYTSLALDSMDRPAIAHYDAAGGDLRVLRCAGSRCDGPVGAQVNSAPDTAGDVGAFASMELDASGFPVIAYHDATNGDLKVLRCADALCTAGTGTFTVADPNLPVGGYISLALDAADNPVISYYDAANGDLKLMRCGDPVCTPSAATITVPDASGDVGQYNSLVLDAAGFPVIAYHDTSNGDLRVLHCDDPACRSDLAPTADAGGPYSAAQGEQVELRGLGDDPDGGGIALAWDLDGDGIFDDAISEVVTVDTTGYEPGEHIVSLQVTDDEGVSVVDTAVLTVTAEGEQPGGGGGPLSDRLRLVSTVDGGGEAGNADSQRPAVSADGALVAFESTATNLHPDDLDATSDVFVRDVTTDEVRLVSQTASGIKGNGDSFDAAISSDGTHVAFTSRATNLDPRDTDTVADVYVVDLASGAVSLASAAGTGSGDGDSNRASLSADGAQVAFDSEATNLHLDDDDAFTDVYVVEVGSGEVQLASTAADGTKGTVFSGDASLSADGTRVAFSSSATNLHPGDLSSDSDVYVKDLTDGSVLLASTTSGGDKGNNSSEFPSLSADGTVVAFQSNATILDPDDIDTFTDIYVKDLPSGELTLASTTAAGAKGDRNSGVGGVVNVPSVTLSGDGTRVAFPSQSTNLHPAATSGINQIYVKDLATGELLLASAAPDGTAGNDASLHPSLSADGTAVAFDSGATNLGPVDTNTAIDVYLRGGPEPTPRLDGDGTGDVRRVAIQVCQVLFPAADGSRTVILARDDVFADALAGAPLAGDDSCVLYTAGGPNQPLDPETRAEIDRALPPGAPIRILGGDQAVSPAVQAELVTAGYAVERFQGASRFETAAAIARVVHVENPAGTDALLAYGLNFPDAVTGGAYGARTGTPILLTDTGSLHPATAAVMSELGVTRTFVLGGIAVISDTAAQQAPGPQRVAGPNRMGTAAAVAQQLWGAVVPTVDTVVISNLELPDGWALTLAAAPLSARLGAPQLGVGTDTYPAETRTYLQGLTPPAATAYLIGNTDVISDSVDRSVRDDLA